MAKQKPVEQLREPMERPVRTIRAAAPFEAFDRFFENMMPRGFGRQLRNEWPGMTDWMQPLEGRSPKVDIIDREAELVLRAELPGVNKKDIDISVSNDTVTLRATTREERKEEKEDYYRSEIMQGEISRTLSLPCAVNGDKARATFRDGMLELTLPKQTISPKRSIAID